MARRVGFIRWLGGNDLLMVVLYVFPPEAVLIHAFMMFAVAANSIVRFIMWHLPVDI